MKSMTCKDLGGACELKFVADSFEEIAEQSKNHGREMLERGDEAHHRAMKNMKELMADPDAMQKWFEMKKAAFDALPEDKS